ncbi:MAG: molybdopterin molybdotransferase MoeA [Arenicella sp.]|nr:molybdopterin molybdotransferase MoeA [Arenicella sp.]
MVLSVIQAQRQILESAQVLCATESVPLHNALARISAQDVVSAIAVPPADNSAMDGFALKSADLGSPPQRFRISQRIPAGAQPQALQANTAARIFTGGVMPEGADAVVIQENCDYPDDTQVTVNCTVRAGDNVRSRGQDIAPGTLIVPQGKRLGPIELGLIASVGEAQITVYRPLRVAIFSTGDELREPGEPLDAGQIYNSNRTVLSALCRQMGYEVIDCGIVADTMSATRTALQRAAGEADVIVSSGGVSVGEEDYVKSAVEALGSLDLWKVQMKPGKPVAYGRVGDTHFIGLPGNPVSSLIVFQLLAQPLLSSLQGEKWQAPAAYQVSSAFNKKAVSREEYIRVQLQLGPEQQWLAHQFTNSSSGVLSSLGWADGLVRQHIDQTISAGDLIEFLPMRAGVL